MAFFLAQVLISEPSTLHDLFTLVLLSPSYGKNLFSGGIHVPDPGKP